MIHACWHSRGRLGLEEWWGCEVCVYVCFEGYLGRRILSTLLSTESCIREGCWQIWVYPWEQQRDCSRSSVSVLMTSLLGQTQFCWLPVFFCVNCSSLKVFTCPSGTERSDICFVVHKIPPPNYLSVNTVLIKTYFLREFIFTSCPT